MKTLITFFCRNHKIGILISLSFLILGLNSLSNSKRDLFPKITTYFASIYTAYPGASPEDIEKKITNKIESELKSIEDIEEFSSISIENSSRIFIRFDESLKDTLKVQNDIQNAILRVQNLPNDLETRPKLQTFSSGPSDRVLQVHIASKGPYKELLDTGYNIKDKLLDIEGVSSVNTSGFRDPEQHIIADLNALKKNTISLSDIKENIQRRNIRMSLGDIKQDNKEFFLISDNELANRLDIESIIIRSNFDKKHIYLKDVAKIETQFKKEEKIERINNQSALSLTIKKKDQADVINTSNRVQAALKNIQKNVPKTITISTSNNLSKVLQDRFNTVFINGTFGLIFIFLILMLFLGSKSAFFISLGIPISILGTVFFMPFFDISINLLSLLALIIILGIIVDDAIIVVESIQQYKEKGLSNLDSAIQGSLAVYKPVITTIITTILAFMPMIFAFQGSDAFVHDIPKVMIIALLISLIECLIALPSHLAYTSIPKKPTLLSFEPIKPIYKNILTTSIKHRYGLSFIFFVLFSITLFFTIKTFQFEYLPSKASYQFFVHFEINKNATLKQTEAKALELGELLLKFPKNEIQSFSTEIGVDKSKREAGISTKNNNKGVLFVNLSLFNERKRSTTQIMNDFRKRSKSIPGIEKLNVSKRGIGPNFRKPIEIIISGNNHTQRKQLTDRIFTTLTNIKGVKNPSRNDTAVKGALQVSLDYEKMARFSLPVSYVLSTIKTALEGQIISSLRMGRYDVDFRLKLPDNFQENTKKILQLPLKNNYNKLIKLKDIATIKQTSEVFNIYHLNGKASTTLTAGINSNETSALRVIQTIQQRFPTKSLTDDIQVTFSGEAQDSAKALSSTFITAGIILLGIYVVLILLFNHFFQPIIVLLSVPFAIFGFITAFAIHQETMSFLAFTGVLGLFGIIVNDSLVMVDKINQLKKQNTQDYIITGALNRLRPILLTTISSVVGMLPIAYGLGGKDPFVQPMALAIGFGLLFSMPFLLILTPCYYKIFEDLSNWKTIFFKTKL